MIIAVTYVIISFLLDSIISNLIPFNLIDPSWFKTIYSIISLVILYNYFDNQKKYLSIVIILGIFFDIVYTNTFILNVIVFLIIYLILSILIVLGIFFDIVYTNTFILNVVVFLIIYLILSRLDYVITTNIFTINLKSIVCISSYHILTYIILLLSNYNNYSIKLLGLILIRSIIMTIIYTTISYLLMNKIYDNKRIK